MANREAATEFPAAGTSLRDQLTYPKATGASDEDLRAILAVP